MITSAINARQSPKKASRSLHHHFRSLVVLGIFIGTSSLHGHSVELTLALFGDLASSFFVLFHKAHLFKLLEDVADDLSRALHVELLLGSPALLATVDLTEAADAAAATDVDLSNHGGAPDVDPVWVIWCQLLLLAGLHNVSPFGDLKAALTLEMLRKGRDELGMWNILDGHNGLAFLEEIIVESNRHLISIVCGNKVYRRLSMADL